MINKRDFLKTGGAAIVTNAGSVAALASVRPRLDDLGGLASWQAHVGQRFEVDGHAVTLQAASPLPGRQPGEQFSLRFTGALPPGIGDAIHTFTRDGSVAMASHLARMPQGLRADFCRLQGRRIVLDWSGVCHGVGPRQPAESASPGAPRLRRPMWT